MSVTVVIAVERTAVMGDKQGVGVVEVYLSVVELWKDSIVQAPNYCEALSYREGGESLGINWVL